MCCMGGPLRMSGAVDTPPPSPQAKDGLGGAPAPAWPFRGRGLFVPKIAVLRLPG
jgi:hypothetical protein